jgi:Flp pilus assembly protein TadB
MQILKPLQQFEQAIKIRVLFVFIFVHAGLGLALFGAGRWVAKNGFDGVSLTVLTGLLLMYLGVLLAAFFIVWPLLPWIRRAREARNWIDRLLHDLPALLEHLPAIIAAIHQITAALREFKNELKQTTPTEPPARSE